MRTKSSRAWLKEHFTDPYVKQAQAKGYRARSAFKLLEIQQKDRLIKPGLTVVDLGASPGGWCQVIQELLKKKGRLFALDILPMDPIDGVDFIQGDFKEEAVFQQLIEKVGAHQVDVVLSDMAPNTSGVKAVDIPRSIYLAEIAFDFARRVLKQNGTFLVKVFQGEGFDDYLKFLRKSFKTIKIRKPQSSRDRSREIYLLCVGFQ